MLKRYVLLLSACVLLLSLTACGTTEVPKGTLISEPIRDISPGSSSAGYYVNSFLGIQCELGDDWHFNSDDEIREINSQAAEMIGEEYEKLIEKSDSFVDMLASDPVTGETVNVVIEKTNPVTEMLGEKDYVQMGIANMERTLRDSGMTPVSTEIDEIDFAGGRHMCVYIQMEINGLTLYEAQAVVKIKGYCANITAVSFSLERAVSILNHFSPL